MSRKAARGGAVALTAATVVFAATGVGAQTADGTAPACRPAPAGTPAAGDLLRRAVEAVGATGDEPLRFNGVERQVQNFQSDRSYPPYFSAFDVQEVVYDPATGAERVAGRFVYPHMGPGNPSTRIATADAAFFVRGEQVAPVPALYDRARRSRLLNPWAALHDWTERGAWSVVASCDYRDEQRLVLESEGVIGPERLFLDRDSGFPVKAEWTAANATWGQRRVEVLWSTWVGVGEGRWFPSASFLLADGEVVRERTVGAVDPAELADVTIPVLPETPAMSPDPWLDAFTAQGPDTVRVDDDTWVLSHRMYNGVLSRVGDTVFVMDATLGEARARQDEAWLETLFPGAEHVVLVVTDVAWPHVHGVRYWVARGATVVSHPANEVFLRELVAREWTVRPDALERARTGTGGDGPTLDFVPVPQEGLDLAGGAVRIEWIGGIGGEGAVMAWLPRADLLWAGDYIQTVDGPSLYATEVVRATERAGITPSRTVAQHLPITGWSVVLEANGGG